ncbi:MAG: SO_0444 family Cu/Zn efflux transporter [Marinilabiliaceae bacterium]|nr:SO_0444 family Cu/Zn efflux transporter [Marinilabiliaceae bacterium]
MEYIITLLNLTGEMAPYLLLGFLIAGLLHTFVPQNLYAQHLGKPTMGSVIKAALLGIPLPLCSCGVMPTTASLRKDGASKGACVSFLTATPQTGVDSILATWSLMGLPMAIIRPIAALFTALFGGWLVNRYDKDLSQPNYESAGECHCHEHSNSNNTLFNKLLNAFRYAFVEMMGDIGKWLVIGLLIASLITVFVPNSWFAIFAGNPLLSYLLVMLIAIPMYICATGSIPIAVSLLMKGITPGAALIMLMAGPATNIASLLIVSKILGKRTTILYIISIVLGALGFALVIDYLLPSAWFVLPNALTVDACCSEEILTPFQIICEVLLGGMLIYALFIHRHTHHHHHHEDDDCCCECEAENRLVFSVKGMKCSHCAANTKKAIMSVKGVTDVEVELAEAKAYVSGSNIDIEEVIKSVSELGFEIEQKS